MKTLTTDSLSTTVAALLRRGKGILAADESFPTIEKRFKAFVIPSTEETRRSYREMLLTTPSLNASISGVILFDETLYQTTHAGLPLPEVLTLRGIVPGIKVDKGTVALARFPGEKITQGLDDLADRLVAYRESGARFTKWRAVIGIGPGTPTPPAIAANAGALARFAALSQDAGLVPIVEPEVLMDGNHSLARCEEVTGATLRSVFAALSEHRVELESMLLKTSMVLPGKECPEPADDAMAAEATLRCLRRTVPAAVPGIVFLSGGQSDVTATRRLNAICRAGDAPWQLSFSFGRALQDEALKTWHGMPANTSTAQAALHHRALCNALAVQGRYSEALEQAVVD
jgi:fructose-bisphosphate aldolase class I